MFLISVVFGTATVLCLERNIDFSWKNRDFSSNIGGCRGSRDGKRETPPKRKTRRVW